MGHIPSDWLVEQAATCNKEGLSYSECTVCKLRLATLSAEKLSHTPGQWVVDEEATCTKTGFKRQECAVCGETVEEAVIPLTDHTPEIIPGREATVKEPGLTDGERCTACQQITKPQQSIPPTGSRGLTFAKNPDSKTYAVTGIGTCQDTVIYIPQSYEGSTVTAIGDEAFAGCTKVVKIYLPETVTAIGDRAFYNSGLTEFTIPEGVKTFGNQIFFQAQKLETVYYNSDYTRESGSIFGATAVKKVVFGGSKVPAYVCRDTQSLTQIVIEKTVTEIGDYAFENCTSLVKAEIPSSVVTVGDGAFKNCTGLAQVTIPDSISAIGTETFAGCAALTEVVIPGSVTRIGTRAFADCGSISMLAVPVSVTNIGQEAFAACTGLTEIHYRGTQAQWSRITKGTDWDKNAGSYVVRFED